jgi:hypothetical protein
MNKTKHLSQKTNRDKFKDLDPKDNLETNALYYGKDDKISTQIVTNYFYNPHK